MKTIKDNVDDTCGIKNQYLPLPSIKPWGGVGWGKRAVGKIFRLLVGFSNLRIKIGRPEKLTECKWKQ